jgi:hypothetical protein
VLIKTGSLWCSQAAAEINHAVSEVTRKIAELLGTVVRTICLYIQINFSALCNAQCCSQQSGSLVLQIWDPNDG